MADEVVNGNIVYAIAIAQFLFGVLITIVNTLMVAVLITTTHLRKNVTHCLLTNMWFANLFLGVIIAVVNVVETSGSMVSIDKPKGTITIINSLVTIATLLTLITNRLLVVRANRKGMTLKNVAVTIALIWSLVFVLTFIKAIVSSLQKYNKSADFKGYQNFEIALLILLGIVSVFFFIITIFKVLLKKKHTIADTTNPPPAVPAQQEVDPKLPPVRTLDMNSNDMHTTVTIGIMLIVFLLVMASYIFMQAVYLYQYISPDASEIVICIFYIHCLINPAVVLCRDKELRLCMKKLLTCKTDNEEVGLLQQQQQQVIYQQPLPMNPYNNQQTLQMVDMSASYPQQAQQNSSVQMENQYHPTNIPRTDTVGSLEKNIMPPIGDHRSAGLSRRPTTAPADDAQTMAVSHIDDRSLHDNSKLSEQNVGFVENGELIRHM